jgi:hypothetical protein
MISKTSAFLALILSATSSVYAVNDWSKPCFQGDCSYDVPASNTSVPASLRIVSFTFSAGASGSPVDTGEIQLFSVGVLGLDIPDVLSIGPKFGIKGRANLDVSLEADMTVVIAYSLKNAAFTFPPTDAAPAQGSPTSVDSPLALSVSPNVTATGSLAAHLIPQLNFGISALGGAASATIFLNLDSSATLDLTLNAEGAVFSTDIDGSETATSAPPAATSSEQGTATTTDSADDASATVTSSDDDALATSAATATDSADNATATDSAADSTSTESADNATSTDSADDAAPTADDGNDPTSTGSASNPAATDGASPDGADSSDVSSSDGSDPSDQIDSSDQTADSDGSDGSDQTDVSDGSDQADAGALDNGSAEGVSDDGGDDNNGAADDASDSDDGTDEEQGSSANDDTDASGADEDSNTDASTDQSTLRRRDVSVNGCVGVDLGIDAKIGAEGSFFGLFDANKDFSLFSKDFKLFKVWFNTIFSRTSEPDRSFQNASATAATQPGVLSIRVVGALGPTISGPCRRSAPWNVARQ